MSAWPSAGLLGVALMASAPAWAHGHQEAARVELMVPGMPQDCWDAAGLAGPAAEPWAFVPRMIRTLYQSSGERNPGLRGLFEYLNRQRQVRDAWRALDAADGALTLASADERASRRRLERLLELLDLRLVKTDAGYQVQYGEPRGSDVPSPVPGVDRSALVDTLNRGGQAALELPSFAVPLSLPGDVWSNVVFGQAVPADELFAAIMADREAALLFYGLAALDPDTRAFLDRHPALLEDLHREHAEVLAAFGRGLRVRTDVVETPGGEAGRGLWESLLGRKTSDPQRFIQDALSADDGHFAFFYDAIAHLDRPRQNFALGLWIPDARERRRRFWELYDVSKELQNRGGAPNWYRRPFDRDRIDLYMVLSQFRVSDTGEPRAPASVEFWDLVFDHLGELDPSSRQVSRAMAGRPVTAEFVVRTVLSRAGDTERRDVLDTMLFAQRVFGEVPEATAAATVELLRLFGTHRMLLLGLERMGISDPGIYAVALRHALQVIYLRSSERARVAMAQYQGALALLERLRLTSVLPAPTTADLILSLSESPLDEDDGHRGAVAQWITDRLLPTLSHDRANPPDEESRESVLVEALSGASAASPRRFRWEGWDYEIQLSTANRRRIEAARERQRGHSLDAVLNLWTLARALLAGVETVEEVGVLGDRLEGVLAGLKAFDAAVGAATRGSNLNEMADSARTELAKVKKPQDLNRLQRVGGNLVRLSDELLADVLLSIVYSAQIRHPEGPLLLGGDVAYRHDFGLTAKGPAERARAAWALPVEQVSRTTRWHLRGALIGLDLAMARLALPRVSVGVVPDANPIIPSEDITALVQTAGIERSFLVDDTQMDGIAAMIAAGRAVVARGLHDRARLDGALEAAGVDEWRRHYSIPWVLDHRPADAVRVVWLAELLWLGLHDSGRRDAADYDAWGAPRLPIDGCLGTSMPPPGPWSTYSGRPGSGIFAARTVELQLRLAEALAEMRLSAGLLGDLLPVAIRDLLDQMKPAAIDDLGAVVRYVAQLPNETIEDYVSKLTVNGPLVPVR